MIDEVNTGAAAETADSNDILDSESKEDSGDVLIVRLETPPEKSTEKSEEAASDTPPQKLSWPKRDTSQQENISTMVTRPLNPGRVKEVQDDTRNRLDARTDDAG